MTGLLGAAAFCILGIEQKSITVRKIDPIAPIAAHSGIRHGQDIEVGLPSWYWHRTGGSIAS
jgi:hypothetical protein